MSNKNPFSSNEFHDDTYKLLQKDESLDSFFMATKKATNEPIECDSEEIKKSNHSLHMNQKIKRSSNNLRIILGGCFCILLFLIILFFPTIKSFYFRNFTSLSTYLTYVEEKNLSDYKLLDSIKELLPSCNSYDFTINADLNLLSMTNSKEMLSPLTISGNFHNMKKDNLTQQALSLNRNGDDPLHLFLTEDMNEETITFSIPELSSYALNLSSSDISHLISSLQVLLSSKEDISYMKSTVKEYVHFLVAELNNGPTIQRSNCNSFHIASHTVDCTEVKITITYKDLHQIMTSLIKKILDDTTLLEFLNNRNLIKKETMIVCLTNYLDFLSSNEPLAISEDYIVLSTFIDKNDAIIGRDLKFNDTTIRYGSITNGTTSDFTLIVTNPSSNYQVDFSRSDLEENWDGNLTIVSSNNNIDNNYISPTNITFTDMAKTESDHTTGTILISWPKLYGCSLSIECKEQLKNQCYNLQAYALMLPFFNASITGKQNDSLKPEIQNVISVYPYEERQTYFNELLVPLSKHPVTKDLYEFYIYSFKPTLNNMEIFTNNS